MGWGEFLFDAALTGYTAYASNESANTANEAQQRLIGLQEQLAGANAASADAYKAAVDTYLSGLGSFGQVDKGRMDALESDYFNMASDATNRAIDAAHGKGRAELLRKGLDTSTFGVELERNAIDARAQGELKDRIAAEDYALGTIGKEQGIRTAGLSEIASRIGGESSIRSGNIGSLLASLAGVTQSAVENANDNANALGQALTRASESFFSAGGKSSPADDLAAWWKSIDKAVV